MSLGPLSHPDFDATEVDFIRVAILRTEILRSGLTEDEIRSDLEATSYGVLLDEGSTVSEIAAVLSTTKFSLDGTRAVLRGAPVEWVRSFEEGAQS